MKNKISLFNKHDLKKIIVLPFLDESEKGIKNIPVTNQEKERFLKFLNSVRKKH